MALIFFIGMTKVLITSILLVESNSVFSIALGRL